MAEHLKPERKHHNINEKRLYNPITKKLLHLNRIKVFTNSGTSTETEQSEHKGFANLLKGFFGMFRNTTAHTPKIKWEMNENDALDIMMLASFFHRFLDKAQKIERPK